MIQMPEYAPLKALYFLGTAGAIGLGMVLIVYFWFSHRHSLIIWPAAGMALVSIVYAALWVGVSMASDEATLPMGQRKYLCELDCNLGYSVEEVHRSDSPSGGVYWTITVGVVFDAETISARRPREHALTPNPRYISVQDEAGRSYDPAIADAPRPWDRALHPGESFTFELRFELPREVQRPRLMISTGLIVDPFLIGHERAPWHENIWFTLEPAE